MLPKLNLSPLKIFSVFITSNRKSKPACIRRFLYASLVFTLSVVLFESCKKDTDRTPKFGSCEAVAPRGNLLRQILQVLIPL